MQNQFPSLSVSGTLRHTQHKHTHNINTHKQKHTLTHTYCEVLSPSLSGFHALSWHGIGNSDGARYPHPATEQKLSSFLQQTLSTLRAHRHSFQKKHSELVSLSRRSRPSFPQHSQREISIVCIKAYFMLGFPHLFPDQPVCLCLQVWMVQWISSLSSV